MKQVVPFLVLIGVDLAAQACVETKPASMMVAIVGEAPAPAGAEPVAVTVAASSRAERRANVSFGPVGAEGPAFGDAAGGFVLSDSGRPAR
jgi:hypothetical protein